MNTPDWNSFRNLARRVLREGAPLTLDEAECELLLRTAQEVSITDTEAALSTPAGAMALLREAERRIAEGSNRLTDALHLMWKFQGQGDLDSARQQMREVLAVEVVPYYRELALEQLDGMADGP
ncbi:DUSAM domain-containing protein [Corallococcus terminator]|uniref:DUF2379 domain-containing protein n=1 Tax=Corallococcus terminator TaxID=2316733 RepID=A0A3A8J9T5_9BACT|nr:DUSAM domain-containing protein [Corallococcus terminator]RKG92459.1 DUF2379 domain-containing protein [Corallococcus terminator]